MNSHAAHVVKGEVGDAPPANDIHARTLPALIYHCLYTA